MVVQVVGFGRGSRVGGPRVPREHHLGIFERPPGRHLSTPRVPLHADGDSARCAHRAAKAHPLPQTAQCIWSIAHGPLPIALCQLLYVSMHVSKYATLVVPLQCENELVGTRPLPGTYIIL